MAILLVFLLTGSLPQSAFSLRSMTGEGAGLEQLSEVLGVSPGVSQQSGLEQLQVDWIRDRLQNRSRITKVNLQTLIRGLLRQSKPDYILGFENLAVPEGQARLPQTHLVLGANGQFYLHLHAVENDDPSLREGKPNFLNGFLFRVKADLEDRTLIALKDPRIELSPGEPSIRGLLVALGADSTIERPPLLDAEAIEQLEQIALATAKVHEAELIRRMAAIQDKGFRPKPMLIHARSVSEPGLSSIILLQEFRDGRYYLSPNGVLFERTDWDPKPTEAETTSLRRVLDWIARSQGWHPFMLYFIPLMEGILRIYFDPETYVHFSKPVTLTESPDVRSAGVFLFNQLRRRPWPSLIDKVLIESIFPC